MDILQELTSNKIENRVAAIQQLEEKGYSTQKIIDFCFQKLEIVYAPKAKEIPIENHLYLGAVSLHYLIEEDFPGDMCGDGDITLYCKINFAQESFQKFLEADANFSGVETFGTLNFEKDFEQHIQKIRAYLTPTDKTIDTNTYLTQKVSLFLQDEGFKKL